MDGVLKELSASSIGRFPNQKIKIVHKENKLEFFIDENNFRGVDIFPKKEIEISGETFNIYDFFDSNPKWNSGEKKGQEILFNSEEPPLKLEEIRFD